MTLTTTGDLQLSEFDGEPVEVIAKRTKRAHLDFADWRVSAESQDAIAKQLKEVPRSDSDRAEGDIRLRSVNDGFEVAFMLIATDDKFIVLVIGYDREGEMESRLSHLKRTAIDGMPPAVKTLVEGRKRKVDL